MTTARDLALVALSLPTGDVERGDLSLGLAGAEAIDLLERGALTLDGDRIVPGLPVTTGDPLLDAAEAALARKDREKIADWLWRRGEGLAAAYVQDLERSGQVAGPGAGATAEQARAEERRASGEPVLTGLLSTLGVSDTPAGDEENPDEDTADEAHVDAADGDAKGDADDDDDPVSTLLAAVGDAVTELEAQRLRRNIENDAFDNVWRGY
ncbi:GPP34 family phosphoprotein [Actinacidiphila rubida]|nr:GPP34 family phosphoprotein [Actinacidiphila rubida]